MTLLFRLAAFVLMLLVSVSATAELVAERVTEENAARRLFGGPDASGGIGDWYLANDLVHFIIDDRSSTDRPCRVPCDRISKASSPCERHLI